MSPLDSEKWMYEKFWTLLRDEQLMRVFKDYGPQAFRRSCVLEGFEDFIKGRGLRGRTIVEIGTLKGLTAIVLSRYFERVVTIDIAEDRDKRKIASDLGIRNIDFMDVRDNAEKARLIESMAFDAAFVDGDHARDTESDFALVKRCGRVLFDEYWPPQPPVVELVDALRVHGIVVTDKKLALWTRRQ